MRSEFNEKISQIPIDSIVYIDESGFDVNDQKEYGYSLKGTRLMANKTGKRSKRITVISGLINRRILIAPVYFESYTNNYVFNAWIEQALLPELKQGQTIVMDNAAFHKSVKTKELIESVGCKLLYLPPDT